MERLANGLRSWPALEILIQAAHWAASPDFGRSTPDSSVLRWFPRPAGYQGWWASIADHSPLHPPVFRPAIRAAALGDSLRFLAKNKTDGVGFEAVSVSACGSSNLRRGDFESEAKGEAVCPPALFGGGRAAATADQAERLGSLMNAEVIPSEVAELASVWHRLPDAVRAGIVAMVRASGG